MEFQHAINVSSIIAVVALTTCCNVLANESAVLASETLDLRALRSLETDSRIRRDDNRLTIRVEPAAHTSVLIPRIYASLRKASRVGSSASDNLIVRPETDYWQIRWKDVPTQAKAIELLFDTRPVLAAEVKPIGQTGDGRIDLHACQATTIGEKLRFEPQPHKNTVGYWVNVDDFATWAIQIERTQGSSTSAFCKAVAKVKAAASPLCQFVTTPTS